MRNSIVIKYYRQSHYGTNREYIHPDCHGSAAIIRQLTGQKTIDLVTRELLRDLTHGAIVFEEVLSPLVTQAFPGGRW